MSNEDLRKVAGNTTRMRLVAAGRRLFGAGYEAVGTPDIAEAAAVTRGALYHHFKDKRALFEAVVEEASLELVKRINADATLQSDKPAEAVVAGCRTFLSACRDPELRQILLVDAPAVLGWSSWRAIDARHGLGSLREGLRECAAEGLMDTADVDAVAYLISGALNEAAFLLADQPTNKELEERIERQTERLVRGFLD